MALNSFDKSFAGAKKLVLLLESAGVLNDKDPDKEYLISVIAQNWRDGYAEGEWDNS